MKCFICGKTGSNKYGFESVKTFSGGFSLYASSCSEHSEIRRKMEKEILNIQHAVIDAHARN